MMRALAARVSLVDEACDTVVLGDSVKADPADDPGSYE
jgi:hypothetical protein